MISLLSSVAFAGPETQTRFDLERGDATFAFSYAWTDGLRRPQELEFRLPATAVTADEAASQRPLRSEMPGRIAAAIRERTAGFPNVEIVVEARENGIQLSGSGTGDVAAAHALATQVYGEALRAWLDEHRHSRFAGDRIGWDLARLVTERADDLEPVAAALRAGTTTDRAFVERALSFVQSIPYEALRDDGGGYRPPLALLSTNVGDCDSKGVLFLGIVRAGLPELPLALVHLPGHVLTGVGLEPGKGEWTFESGGVFVYAEPVGPAQHPLGEVADRRAADRGEIRVVSRR